LDGLWAASLPWCDHIDPTNELSENLVRGRGRRLNMGKQKVRDTSTDDCHFGKF